MSTLVSTVSNSEKRIIFDLELSPHCPTLHLVPDPLFPTPASYAELSKYTAEVPTEVLPSMVRRSRQIRSGANFSYVSPLPLTFPYDITEVDEESTADHGKENMVRVSTIETRLAELEPSLAHPVPIYRGAAVEDVKEGGIRAEGGQTSTVERLAFTSPLREKLLPKATLMAYSKRCEDEMLPQLDSGDATTFVTHGAGSIAEVYKREQLINILSGKHVMIRDGDTPFSSFSLAYAGHQFGQFAGQLGDGRAISLYSTPTTPAIAESTSMSNIEIQLKGAGRTPFSRFADGLAVTRSSIREFLGSEAMGALNIPTSRALALVGIPSVKARRERMESCAIVTRLAPSWIRIGCFELPLYREEWESLRILTSFTARSVFHISDATCPPTDSSSHRSLALEMLKRSSANNAKTVAGWQAYGFQHAVINTDNVSVRGETIDYGPFAFMDIYDPRHICNTSDGEGRYTLEKQPTMILFAINKLGEALSSLIGCESEIVPGQGYSTASEGWRDGVEDAKIETWTAIGMERLAEVKSEFVQIFLAEYTRLMRLRLGLLTSDPADFDSFSTLLDLMNLHSLDYHGTIRLLSQFPSTTSPLLSAFLDLLLPADLVPAGLQQSARVSWTKFFETYQARLDQPQEVEAAKKESRSRRERMNAVNPRFVLRQWVLEETIKRVEEKNDLKALNRVLMLAGEPYEAYGEKVLGGDSQCSLDVEAVERARLCALGEENMLGFQCSCSS